ncbi:luciferase domain-containing protein [Halegenticoccus soli]|uniref:luciferase domain-containing protein n=1 Tax=Halegenticoccus soli TaxID=1985678 RepID=UPI000C6E00E4|nr:luciferase family protein [Halegenticoccus soli]
MQTKRHLEPVVRRVGSWPGVETAPRRFDGREPSGSGSDREIGGSEKARTPDDRADRTERGGASDGGIEFRVREAEIGHVHPDEGLIDVPFTREIRNQLLTEGKADRHHVRPESSWVTYRIRGPDDVRDALWLLRLAYLNRLAALSDGEAATVAPGLDIRRQLDRLRLSPDLRRLVDPAAGRRVPLPATE